MLGRFGRSNQPWRAVDQRAAGQPANGTTLCFAMPNARENYVKVCPVAPPGRPRMSWASELSRPSSAHSCELCIGVGRVSSLLLDAVTQSTAFKVPRCQSTLARTRASGQHHDGLPASSFKVDRSLASTTLAGCNMPPPTLNPPIPTASEIVELAQRRPRSTNGGHCQFQLTPAANIRSAL